MSNDEEKTSILIVDDKPENLLSLEAILEDLDLDIVRCTSGKDALWAVLKQDFSLIILDVYMPDMDGYETAKMIREKVKTKNIPIIFLTAVKKESEDVLKGFEAGGTYYLRKPIDPENLKNKVVGAIESYKRKLTETED